MNKEIIQINAFEGDSSPNHASWYDRDALTFLASSGIAKVYKNKFDEWLERYDDGERRTSRFLARGLLRKHGPDIKHFVRAARQYDKEEKEGLLRIAQSDLKVKIGKGEWQGDTEYFVDLVNPDNEKQQITLPFGYFSESVLRFIGVDGKVIEDFGKLGLTPEQIQSAVDYVDARIANGGEPLGDISSS